MVGEENAAAVPDTPTAPTGATALARRSWVPDESEDYVEGLAQRTAGADIADIDAWIHALTEDNRRIHESDAINLNPATNTMNPRAEALLAAGLGSRPSLGYPGDKYEMGLEAIEQIEVITAELAAEVFEAGFAEIRVASGAMANLYAFMAVADPGDAIIVPPAVIGGHVTHHTPGAAGLYGLEVHEAPVDADGYTVDVERLADLADAVRPKLLTVGASLNLFHHPIAELRAVADAVGATVLFDAAHLSGPIAGRAWPNPLREGAHVMTMSTYKSLGGPPSGLLVTDVPAIAERVDAIAFPGLTANFDVGSSAALAITLLDWSAEGRDYAAQMVANAQRLATGLASRGVEVFAVNRGATRSHAFAVDANAYGNGHTCARRLRRANLLTSAIGLPHDAAAGLRLGTNELTRWGATAADMEDLASLVSRALHDEPETVAADATAWRRQFTQLHFIRSDSGRQVAP